MKFYSVYSLNIMNIHSLAPTCPTDIDNLIEQMPRTKKSIKYRTSLRNIHIHNEMIHINSRCLTLPLSLAPSISVSVSICPAPAQALSLIQREATLVNNFMTLTHIHTLPLTLTGTHIRSECNIPNCLWLSSLYPLLPPLPLFLSLARGRKTE